MLVVEFHPVDKEYLTVKFKYYTDYVNRMRKVPGAVFNTNLKTWIIPVGALEWLEDLFSGELFFKTPRWVILDEPAPDYSQMYNVPDIPLPTLALPLKQYQEFGVKFMVDKLLAHGFVINCDDVGLGKTPQAIATMEYFRQHHNVKKVLVICKKSLRTQWKKDGFGKFLPGFPNTVVSGTVKKRLDSYAAYTDGAMIVNYHTVMNDVTQLQALKFDMVIIDEAHKVATRTGVINHAIRDVCKKVKYIQFLTGTPVMSTPEDIFGIVQIATPAKNFFGTWKEFSERHIVYCLKGRFTEIVGYRNLDILRSRVQDIIIRRTEHEVEVELPEMMMDKIEVETDPTQNNIIIAVQEETNALMAQVENCHDQDLLKILQDKLKGVGAARQAVADDPRLFLMSKSVQMVQKYGGMIPKSYSMSPKTEALMELLQNILDSGHKAIVFTKFERAVRMLQDDIAKELKTGVVSYSGKIDDDVRDANVEAFWNDPDVNVFVANDAAAEGLNLQVAKYVINYDQPDTPGLKTQRFGRVRRLDSKFQHVYQYDLITLGTKDEEKLNELEMKENLFDGVVGLDSAQSDTIKNIMKG